jgi:hypothetical protein
VILATSGESINREMFSFSLSLYGRNDSKELSQPIWACHPG